MSRKWRKKRNHRRQMRRRRNRQRRHCHGTDIHHRRPKAGGFGGDCIRVDKQLHRFWSAMFPGTMSVHEIANAINRYWIDSRYQFVVVERSPNGGG